MLSFGSYIRARRLELGKTDPRRYSLRQVAHRIGVEPAYLSKIELGQTDSLSEAKIMILADELGEDRDVLLALGGKISDDLLEVIRRRPRLFGDLIRSLREVPDHAIVRLVREVRDGDW
jgi:transcriptional regulator with XRE-family HTH domain